jgi:hypothetical protein
MGFKLVLSDSLYDLSPAGIMHTTTLDLHAEVTRSMCESGSERWKRVSQVTWCGNVCGVHPKLGLNP